MASLPLDSRLRPPAPTRPAPRKLVVLRSATERIEGDEQKVCYVRQDPAQICAPERAAIAHLPQDMAGPWPSWRTPLPHAAARTSEVLGLRTETYEQMDMLEALHREAARTWPVLGESDPPVAVTTDEHDRLALARMGWTFEQRRDADGRHFVVLQRLHASKRMARVSGNAGGVMLPARSLEVYDLAVPDHAADPPDNHAAPAEVRRISVHLGPRSSADRGQTRAAGDAVHIGRPKLAHCHDLSSEVLLFRPRTPDEPSDRRNRTLVVIGHGDSKSINDIPLAERPLFAFDTPHDTTLVDMPFPTLSQTTPSSVHWVADGRHHIDVYAADHPGNGLLQHGGSPYAGHVADIGLSKSTITDPLYAVLYNMKEMATMLAVDQGVDVALVRKGAEAAKSPDGADFSLATLIEQLRHAGLYDDYDVIRVDACRIRSSEVCRGVGLNPEAGSAPIAHMTLPVETMPPLIGHADVNGAASFASNLVLDPASPATFAQAMQSAIETFEPRHRAEVERIASVANDLILESLRIQAARPPA